MEWNILFPHVLRLNKAIKVHSTYVGENFEKRSQTLFEENYKLNSSRADFLHVKYLTEKGFRLSKEVLQETGFFENSIFFKCFPVVRRMNRIQAPVALPHIDMKGIPRTTTVGLESSDCKALLNITVIKIFEKGTGNFARDYANIKSVFECWYK